MMMNTNNCYVGVVEDRHDPEQMGRVRVRVFALHNDDRKVEVPIASLPWSIVLHSGSTPTPAGNVHQLKEGTWVLVMFLDKNYQESVVLGSLPTRFTEQPDYEKGFSDPFGVYPRFLDETTLVSRESEWLKHPTYNEREKHRVLDIPIAKRNMTPTVSSLPSEDRELWEELDLRGEQESQYPYNAVQEFESGIIEEHDSTPSNSRTTKMHRSGTYEEILHDGSRTIKIVGEGYHITLENHNIYIEGNMNLTVGGNVRQYVQGDYILEVDGDYSMTVGGTRQAKVNGDNLVEVVGTDSTSIAGDLFHRCQGDRRIDITGNDTYNCQGTRSITSNGPTNITASQDVVVKGANIRLN